LERVVISKGLRGPHTERFDVFEGFRDISVLEFTKVMHNWGLGELKMSLSGLNARK
jgi:hypothetical protein